MATIQIPANPEFPDVYQWDYEDDVIGGDNGIATRPIRELTERSAYLKIKTEQETAQRKEQVSLLNIKVNKNEEDIQAHTVAISNLKGRGGYLTANDFETDNPTQEELTDYALAQITNINDALEIWDGTRVKNLFDGHVWVLNNTQNTDPPIFEWCDNGSDSVDIASNTGLLGLVTGEEEAPDSSTDGMITVDRYGKMRVIGFGRQKESHYPIGIRYTQYPNDYSPNELKAKGVFPANSHWELWNHRAEQYGLAPQLPSNALNSIYTPGSNYAANTYVRYHLDGDDYTLFKAKAAVTNAAQQIEPVLWDKFQPEIFVPRRFLQEWIDGDFAIGHQIEGGEYDGMYVAEINVCGGKFPSFAGGNRPPFIDGGTAGDMIRNFTGYFYTWSTAGGKLFIKQATDEFIVPLGDSYNANRGPVQFNPSMVVPTGPENSDRTFSTLTWRRVA